MDHDKESTYILIGSDYYWDIVTGKVIRGESGPTAINSNFGWLLSGPSRDPTNPDQKVVSNLIIMGESELCQATNEHDDLIDSLKQFWETESIGIQQDATR